MDKSYGPRRASAHLLPKSRVGRSGSRLGLPAAGDRGGLVPTEKEARKRKAAKDAAKVPKQPKGSTYGQLVKNMVEANGSQKLGLTKEEVDPDFKGTQIEWIDKYGHVQLRSKAQMEIDRDTDAYSAWVGGFKALRKPLEDYLKLEKFKPANFDAWIKRAGSQERRLAETRESVSLIVRTRESVEWPLPMLKDA